MIFSWLLWAALQIQPTASGFTLHLEAESKASLPVAVPSEDVLPEVSAPAGVTWRWSPPLRFRDLTLRILDLEVSSSDTPIAVTFTYPPASRPLSQVPSESFWSFYEAIPGASQILSGPAVRGGYLIIAPDAFLSTLTPLVQWLQDQGYTVWTVGLSQTGTTTSEIQAFIQNVYDTWVPKVEFVVLAADVDIVGGPGIPAFTYGLDATDLPYALLDGEDYLPDVWIGRLPVDNTLELQVVVQKILGYEKSPDLSDTLWYRRALMVASTHYAITTKLTKLVIRDRLLDRGYLQVDTVFWYPVGPQPGAEDLMAVINEGVGLINYRGWSGALGWHEPPFFVPQIGQLQNGWRLPVLYNITCGSGNFASSVDPAFGEEWLRAGTPANPKGGVGFFGPTNPSVHTRWNNAIDAGIFEGLLFEGIRRLAPSGVRGLFQLFWEFPGREGPGDSIEFYFHVYNTLGLPSLQVHVGVPHALAVEHLASIGPEGGAFPVQVTFQGQPVTWAYVALTAPDHTLLAHGPVDEQGIFYGEVPANPGDSVRVTVTAPGHRPYLATVPVLPSNLPLAVDTVWIVDNNDGSLNPQETATLRVQIRNVGTQSINAGSGLLRSVGTWASVVDSTAQFPSLGPGGQAVLEFSVSTVPDLPDGEPLTFELVLQVGNASRAHYLHLWSASPDLQVLEAQANPVLNPGTLSSLSLHIANRGSLATGPLTMVLRSAFTGIEVVDSQATLAGLAPGSEAWTGDVFSVQTLPDVVPGRDIWFRLDWSTSGGAEGTVYFSVPVGPAQPDAPMGPDPYGYWAYDDTDTLAPWAPTYAWVELDPAQGGNGTLLALGDDSTVVLSLPFVFRYYGNEFTQVSVCSNGWIAFDSTWYFHFRNWPIPSPHGPENLVAIYWDDLTVENGGVFYAYDATNHRWIVEWKAVNRLDNQTPEVFEVILYDPAYWPTPTGDGEIVMQYQDVQAVSGGHYEATVGIEDRWHLRGLQYVYGSYYHPHAAELVPGRAIRWTTLPPDSHLIQVQEPGTTIPRIPQIDIPTIVSVPTLQVTLFQRTPVQVRIYDITGRQIDAWSRTLPSGTHRISLEATTWPAGVYVINVQAGHGHLRRPILILR